MASELQQLRLAAGFTQREVAERLGGSPRKVSDLEIADNVPGEEDLQILLPLYGAPERVAEFTELRTIARKRGWWSGKVIIPKWFREYLGYEESAQSIDIWNGLIIPELLQTKAYAMAQLQETMPDAPAEHVVKHVAIRMRRQEVWQARGAERAQLRVVLAEAALRASAQSATIMREQYEHLLELDSSVIELQVLQANLPPLTSSPFARLRFDIPNDHGVLYAETPTIGHYFKEQQALDDIDAVFSQLRSKALSQEKSKAFIRQLITEL